MVDTTLLSPEKILSISMDKPEVLYKGSTIDEVKKMYRKFSAIWHPDKNLDKDTTAVFAHVKVLYEKAVEKIENGTWQQGQVVFFTSSDGKKYKVKYQAMHLFDLGVVYISSKFVTWIFNKDCEDLLNRGLSSLTKLKYANDKMKLEMSKYVPEIHAKVELNDGIMLVMKKKTDIILLKDILNHFGGKMPVKHAAWVISSMYNMACFTQYNGIMHGGFSLDNYFIYPQAHEGHLLGGWWFSHTIGEKLVALTQTGVDIAPVSMINKGVAHNTLDLEMIKLVGRQLLGDSSGVYLANDKTIPANLVRWLRDGAGKNAVKEYEGWHKVLTDSFGVRRFTELNLTENDIYSKGE